MVFHVWAMLWARWSGLCCSPAPPSSPSSRPSSACSLQTPCSDLCMLLGSDLCLCKASLSSQNFSFLHLEGLPGLSHHILLFVEGQSVCCSPPASVEASGPLCPRTWHSCPKREHHGPASPVCSGGGGSPVTPSSGGGVILALNLYFLFLEVEGSVQSLPPM